MTPAERARVVELLTSSRDALLARVDTLTDAAWQTSPSPGAWSPCQIVEHLTKVEESVVRLVTERLPSRPPAPEGHRAQASDDDVVRLVEDRTRKATAPERVLPSEGGASREEVVDAFQAARRAAIQYAETTADDLRSRLAPHPAVGLIDAYQWLLFLGAHTNRHGEQIRALKIWQSEIED